MIDAQTAGATTPTPVLVERKRCLNLESMYRDAHASAFEAYQRGDRRAGARWIREAVRLGEDAKRAKCTWFGEVVQPIPG
jgi:hypothetical protein